MKIQALAVIAALAAALSGCSTIFSGMNQDISLQSTPDGAHCSLLRQGKTLASVDATPAVVNVTRTKNDITMTCALPGYRTASMRLHSGIAGYTFGNIVFGGLIGWGIDSSTGADNEYPNAVNLPLMPVTPPPPASTGLAPDS